MNSPPRAHGRRIAAAGHIAGFLSASFLIERLWQASGLATRMGRSPLDAVVGLPSLPSLPVPTLSPLSPQGAGEWLIALTQGAIVPATLEELFFRGLVFEFIRRAKGEIAAICVSASLFGLAHPGLAHTAAAGLLGLYLGTLRARWGLALPLVAHVLNNALALWVGAARPAGGPALGPAALDLGTGSGLADPWLWLAIGLVGNSAATLRQEMRNSAPEPATETRRSLQRSPAQDENGI